MASARASADGDRRDCDVLVLGDVNPDLVFPCDDVELAWGQAEQVVDEATLAIGGSGAIFACGAAHLGLRTSIVGVVGDDLFGRFMRDALRECGVDVSQLVWNPGRPTGVGVHLTRVDDRAMLTSLGTIALLAARDVPREALAACRHLHVASYFLQELLQPDVPALLREARLAGATTSLDTNWDPSGRWDGSLAAALAEVDVFFPNGEEACRISGASDPVEGARRLALQVDTVVVKLGAEGAVAVRGAELAQASAPNVDVVDTIGAGDSFDAGFIAGFLSGLELDECLRLAVLCGSLSTRARGGTTAQATLAEVRESPLAGQLPMTTLEASVDRGRRRSATPTREQEAL